MFAFFGPRCTLNTCPHQITNLSRTSRYLPNEPMFATYKKRGTCNIVPQPWRYMQPMKPMFLQKKVASKVEEGGFTRCNQGLWLYPRTNPKWRPMSRYSDLIQGDKTDSSRPCKARKSRQKNAIDPHPGPATRKDWYFSNWWTTTNTHSITLPYLQISILDIIHIIYIYIYYICYPPPEKSTVFMWLLSWKAI